MWWKEEDEEEVIEIVKCNFVGSLSFFRASFISFVILSFHRVSSLIDWWCYRVLSPPPPPPPPPSTITTVS